MAHILKESVLRLARLSNNISMVQPSGFCQKRIRADILTPLLFISTRKKSSKTAMSKQPSLVIDKNIHLRFNSYASTEGGKSQLAEPPSLATIEPGSRPLVVLIAWLMASESNLEKYRAIYFKHGFDVLTVKTTPVQMMLPAIGSQVVAQNLLNFLKNQVGTYPNILIHGFSVGGYQFGEMLLKLQEGLSCTEVDGTCEIVRKAIKGMIFDSGVDVDGAAYGISRSIAGENWSADLLEKAIIGYMKVFYNVATRHYEKSSRAYKNTPVRCPALMLISKEDRLGNPASNEVVAACWRQLGIEVGWKCFDKSRHVGHLHKYPKEYVEEVTQFLRKINLGTNLDLPNALAA